MLQILAHGCLTLKTTNMGLNQAWIKPDKNPSFKLEDPKTRDVNYLDHTDRICFHHQSSSDMKL